MLYTSRLASCRMTQNVIEIKSIKQYFRQSDELVNASKNLLNNTN